MEAIRGARTPARRYTWEAGARPETITLSIEATLLGATAGKEGTAEKQGRHPLLCHLDETGSCGWAPAWQAAIDAEGKVRDDAWVTELTEDFDVSAWPTGRG